RRERREKRKTREARRHRAARRHDHCAGEVLLMPDQLQPLDPNQIDQPRFNTTAVPDGRAGAPGIRALDAPGLPAGSNPAPSGPVPGYGYGSNVLGDTEVHLTDYIKVLYKRRW